MKEEDQLEGSLHKELMREGSFRLIYELSHSSYTPAIIQHDCPRVGSRKDMFKGGYYSGSFNWGRWRYCWHRTRKCCVCGASVPDTLTGIKYMVNWKRM